MDIVGATRPQHYRRQADYPVRIGPIYSERLRVGREPVRVQSRRLEYNATKLDQPSNLALKSFSSMSPQ